MGIALASDGGAAMNDDYDDDLLFGLDDIESYKRGEQPKGWFEARKNILLARCRAQQASLEKFLASAPPAVVARFNQPL